MQDYLSWRSQLSLEEVFASTGSFSYPFKLDKAICYQTSLQHEQGRTVIMRGIDGQKTCLTPKPYSLRTKINEYGGKPFWLFEDQLIFANQEDQCLYRQSIRAEGKCGDPQRITVNPSDERTHMYGDVCRIDESRYIAVVELREANRSAAENLCFIGLIDTNTPDQPPRILAEGADFYSNLVFDIHRKRVAWVQWNHPNMPWDENQLCTASLGQDFRFNSVREVSLEQIGHASSACQLMFDERSRLLFSADFCSTDGAQNFWNIYRLDIDQQITTISAEKVEFGYPHWQYGDSRIVALDNRHSLMIGSAPEGDQIFLLDTESNNLELVYQSSSTIQSLCSDESGRVVAIELFKQRPPAIVCFAFKGEDDKELVRSELMTSGDYALPVSESQAIQFPSRDGGRAYAFYYSPVNHHAKPHGQGANKLKSPPPLLVMVHGGPTARAYGHFDLQKQFWCSNGFAILDVNHRGSSGFGRRFRDQLYGQWGVIDTSDVIDGISWLIEQGMADGDKVCIRGKSAGGYAVLCALTDYLKVFKAGACYYGIGNLATLAEITHKFEKHYTDRLLGEDYDPESANQAHSLYYQRSPIHKIEQINSAMVVFQGGEDKIVPPALAHEIIAQLADNQIPHEYVEYPDEGHGFRQASNNIDAWQRELAFYRHVLTN